MVGKLKFFVTIIFYGLNRSVLFWNYLDEKALFLKRILTCFGENGDTILSLSYKVILKHKLNS